MKLIELPDAVVKAKQDLDAQDKYVQQLGLLYTQGQTQIEVYTSESNTWTTVDLKEFWQIQHNKYLAMSGYAGDLDGLEKNLQAALDAALQSILPPEDRIAGGANVQSKTK